MKRVLWSIVCLTALVPIGEAQGQTYDLVIRGGRAIDPETGLDGIRNIGIMGDSIAALTRDPISGTVVIDAHGLVVTPGFIDVNTTNLDRQSNEVRALDGVTTALVTESPTTDVDEWYSQQSVNAPINYGTAVGFWQARLDVMGDPSLSGTEQWVAMEHSKASEEDIARVLAKLDDGLRRGAIAIGLPLEYIPAATQAEVLAVFRLAARHKAPAHVHMRGWGYDDKRVRSYGDLYEVIGASIASGAQAHILHINSSYNEWTPIGLELITNAQARGLPISADAYPYAFGGCPSSAAYFDDWESYPEEYFATKLRVASTGEWMTRETFADIRRGNEEVQLLCYDNTEEMVVTALASSATMIASDGGGSAHPRNAGTYSRFLGHYVRSQDILPLSEAVRKLTLMPATHFEERVPAMRRKGRLQVGADADITILDLARIEDQSTISAPMTPSIGVRFVLVAGEPIVWDGVVESDASPGRAVRAPLSR